jgi:hypothetical protein
MRAHCSIGRTVESALRERGRAGWVAQKAVAFFDEDTAFREDPVRKLKKLAGDPRAGRKVGRNHFGGQLAVRCRIIA